MGETIEISYDMEKAKEMARDPENQRKADEVREKQNKPFVQGKPNPFEGMDYVQPLTGVNKRASNEQNQFNIGVNISKKKD